MEHARMFKLKLRGFFKGDGRARNSAKKQNGPPFEIASRQVIIFRRDKSDTVRVSQFRLCAADLESVTTIAFDVGVLLRNATLSIGTSTFASGKYVAAHRRGMSYGTATNCGACRNSSFPPLRKWLVMSS